MKKFYALIGIAIFLIIGSFGLATASAAPVGAASGLKITQEGCTSGFAKARLSWTASGRGEQRVQLSSVNNGFASGFSTGIVGRDAGATQLVQLQPGTRYYARVVTGTGSNALVSDTVSFIASCQVTAFTAPTNLQSAAASNITVRFAWTPGQNNKWFCVDTARSFEDLRSRTDTWRNYCRTDANTLTVTGLRCGATYVWSVYSWNGGLNAMSSPSTVTTTSCVIGQPTQLAFRQTGNDSVRLSWSAGKNNRWYCIDVAESESDLNKRTGTWENFSCWQTRTTLDLIEVECGKVYYFNIYAWNESVNTRSANASFELLKCKADVNAVIDDLFIEATADDPPHYMLTVVGVLPNDCYEYDSHKVSRKDNVLTVTVVNELDKDGKCSKNAATYELDIDLGTKFESGNRYTVNVNNERIRFTAD